MRADAGRAEVDRLAIDGQLQELGVEEGAILLVHSSFRALGPIEGGPAGLIEALLDRIGPEGTLVMPAWGDDDDTPFDRAATPVAADLGVVAQTFARREGVVRSNHSQAFAAYGPDAEIILSDPLPLPPHILASPVGRVYEMGGRILLLGVGHDASSTVHLAEILAGVPYGVEKHCTVLEGGERITLTYRENDHCCARFSLLDGWLRAAGLQRDGTVGHAQARSMSARDVVRVALEHLAEDPLIFLHAADDGCEECDEARRSIR